MGIRGERPSSFLLGRSLWQAFGNLNNGGNAGLWYVNGNNGLGNANWNIGSRRSCRDQQHFRHVYPAPAWVTGHARSTERNCLKATGLVAKAFEDSADTKS